MDRPKQCGVTFRCPPELEAILPRPIPATLGLPDAFRGLQQTTAADPGQRRSADESSPPVIDAMTYGFLMPLACDLTIENGEFTWQRDLPPGFAKYSRSPIDFHDSIQVAGTPFFDEDRFIIKFNNFWTIELPPGYSLLVTHPVNRDDLPFTTLTGLVDADRFCKGFVHFPARWRDPAFNGTLAKGTPVAQCLPIEREIWTGRFETLPGEDRLREPGDLIPTGSGVYRRRFWPPKR
jgi:hypothetical protein